MRAGMVEDDFSGGCINFVDEYPGNLSTAQPCRSIMLHAVAPKNVTVPKKARRALASRQRGALNVAFIVSFPFALKGVVLAFRRKRLFVDDHRHDINKFCHVLTTFLGKGKFFFELAGSVRDKQKSTPQVRQQFFKSVEPLGGNVPALHSLALFKRGDGFGVGN